jgi:signal peptidase I
MFARFLTLISTQLVRIRGGSMEPSLPDGAWALVSRRAYHGPQMPQRFDIVRFEEPGRRGHWIVKRIVALPGEEARLEDGKLFINGETLTEPHAVGIGASGKHEWWPRDDEYVTLGDNRDASTDSRKFGTVPLSAIRGKVVRRVR